MGMITESAILSETRQTNALLQQLLIEQRHTNDVLRWLAEAVHAQAAATPAGPGGQQPA